MKVRVAESVVLLAAVAMLIGCAANSQRPNADERVRQVADTERAFARSMADRDHAAFTSFLSAEAIFVAEPKVLRGKEEIAAAWKRYYERPGAPFSWEPAQVEVLESGTLALSTGPVRDAKGKLIGTFTSIWRLQAPGVWRIIFDQGNEICDCGKP